MENSLEQSIIKAISHLDVLSRPLTLLELVDYLDRPATANQVYSALNREPLNRVISQQNGKYFLRDRPAILQTKHHHYRLALKKLALANYYCQVLKFFPWIRGLAIYGSLASKNSREQGDIDLFFVTTENRLWSARFFINSTLKLLRLRPTPKVTKNRICPSYLADTDHLDLSVANIEPDYYYYYYGSASFNFLYAEPGVAEKFFRENSWIKKSLPNWQPAQPNKTSKPTAIKLKKILELILGLIPEKTYQKIQLKILPQQYQKANDGKRVILSAGLIKLHHNDRRIENNRLFEENFNRHRHA